MKYRYSKFTGDDLDELDLEELLSRLSDLLLSSGFDDGYCDAGRGRPLDAVAARRDHGGAAQRRPALGRDARAAARQGLADERRCGGAARRADSADHREAAAPGLRHRRRRISKRERERREARPAAVGGAETVVQVRDHRQEPRLPRLPRAARSARLDRQEQPRPARHARDGDRRRGQRRAEAVRVRRHDEPRRQRDDPERGDAPSRRRAASGSASPRQLGRCRSTSTTRT